MRQLTKIATRKHLMLLVMPARTMIVEHPSETKIQKTSRATTMLLQLPISMIDTPFHNNMHIAEYSQTS